jgi:hypothetical protein
MITLIGTIAGCYAVTTGYLGWLNRQRQAEEISDIVRFDPSRAAIEVRKARRALRSQFFLALTALITYAALPEGMALPLILNALAMYCFYSALVTCTLAARDVEQRQIQWEALDPAQQAEIRNRLALLRDLKREMVQLASESPVERVKLSMRKMELDERRRKSAELRRRLRRAIENVYRWSIEMRHRVGGDLLLTVKEGTSLRPKQALREHALADLRQRLDLKRAREAYGLIQSKAMRSFRDERTGLEYFRANASRYLLVETELDEKGTKALIAQLANGVGETGTPLGAVTIFIADDVGITDQARALLAEREIEVYRPAEWSKGDSSLSG